MIARARTLRDQLRTLHKWLALGACVPLAIVTITGILVVFHDNVLRWRLGEALAPVETVKADVAGDLARLDAIVAPAAWTLVKLPEPDLPAYRIWLDTGEQAWLVPGASSLLDRYHPEQRPESAIFELHSTLLAGAPGEQVVGLTGFVALFLLASGLYVWWPAARSWRRADLVVRTRSRREALRAHTAWSVLAAPLLLAMIVTGILLTYFDAARTALGWIAGPAAVAGPAVPDAVAGIEPGVVDWRGVMATANGVFDDDEPVFVFPPAKEGGAVRMRTRRGAEWHPNGRSTLLIHPRTGELLASQDATRVAWPTRFLNTLYPLHAARGAAARTWPLVLASGLALAMLMVLGVLGWWRRARSAAPPVSGAGR